MNFDADLHVAMRKAIFEISVPREPQVLFRIDHVEGGGGDMMKMLWFSIRRIGRSCRVISEHFM